MLCSTASCVEGKITRMVTSFKLGFLYLLRHMSLSARLERFAIKARLWFSHLNLSAASSTSSARHLRKKQSELYRLPFHDKLSDSQHPSTAFRGQDIQRTKVFSTSFENAMATSHGHNSLIYAQKIDVIFASPGVPSTSTSQP